MKFNRLCSMALAATIAVGVMAPGITAFADGNTTNVTLTVAAKNQYTMTIPAATALNTDGSAVALANGLNIEGDNMTKNVVVTMTGANDWKMTAQGVQTKIGYAVYERASSETALTEVEFDMTWIMEEGGFTKDLYAKANAADVAAADPGDYTGTIIFTAALKSDAPAKVTIGGVEIVAENGQTWATIAANNSSVTIDSNDEVKINGHLVNFEGRWFVTSDETFDSSSNYILWD